VFIGKVLVISILRTLLFQVEGVDGLSKGFRLSSCLKGFVIISRKIYSSGLIQSKAVFVLMNLAFPVFFCYYSSLLIQVFRQLILLLGQ